MVVMRLMLGVMVAGAAALLSHCGAADNTSGIQDTWTDPDGVGRGTVSIDGDDPLVLMHRQSVTVTGTYLGPTGVGSATALDVGFSGFAQDATVNATTVNAGADGVFSFVLTAGSVDATFGLRVRALDGAEDEIVVEVTLVADTGLSLDASYGGRRSVDFYRVVVTAAPVGLCPVPGDEVLLDTSTMDDSLPVVLEGLPSSTLLQVSLSGAWCPAGATVPDGCEAWVSGCADGIELAAGDPQDGMVTLADDLTTFGATELGVDMQIDASALSEAWATALLLPLDALVDETGDPALFLIDGIYARVESEMGFSQADLFSGARTAGSMDADVGAAITADLASDLQDVRDALASELAGVKLYGTLAGDFWGSADQSAVLTLTRVGGPSSWVDATLALAAVPAAAEVGVTYLHDEVTLGEHTLPVGAGELALAVLEAQVLPSLAGPSLDWDPLGVEQYLVGRVDCAQVGAVIASDPDAASIADGAWYAAACEQVLASLGQQVRDAAGSLDTVFGGPTLRGSCDYLGPDGMPHADMRCAGTLTQVSWGEEPFPGENVLGLGVAE